MFVNTMANIETYERMKSSELLRHCVDTYMAPTWLRTLGGWCGIATINPLCITLVHYLNDLDQTQISWEDYSELDMQVKRIKCRIEDHLVQVTTIYNTISGWLRNSYPEQHSPEDIQNIRFMCAEFIALELEDEGD